MSLGIHDRLTQTANDQIEPSDLGRWAGHARIIDVREPAEFTGELGHLPGAELVPLSTLARAATPWDHDATLIVVCRSGGRSSAAQRQLHAMGFRRVLNLRGGMLAVDAGRLPVDRTG